MSIAFPLSILKPFWRRDEEDRWRISDVSPLRVGSPSDAERRFFPLRGEVQLLSNSGGTLDEVLASFGPAEFLLQQSIVPVVSWFDGEKSIRCIGTAFIISCTGYLVTASHVMMDPLERGYGAERDQAAWKFHESLNFGVLVPRWTQEDGMRFRKAHIFYPFVKMWNWGSWNQSPLLHEPDRFDHLVDVAICKIPEAPTGVAHQPLSLSLNPFDRGEEAYAIGYAEMQDIELRPSAPVDAMGALRTDLFMSVGNVIETFPNNHIDRQVMTPGPCFDFKARIPGKMSGAPIFGARGAVVRGVVSRSFSGEDHAYGSMLGPSMDLDLREPSVAGRTLRSLIDSGNEGMAKVIGDGL